MTNVKYLTAVVKFCLVDIGKPRIKQSVVMWITVSFDFSCLINCISTAATDIILFGLSTVDFTLDELKSLRVKQRYPFRDQQYNGMLIWV